MPHRLTTSSYIQTAFLLVALLNSTNAFAVEFFDDFNRPDGPIGNGWTTISSPNDYHFELRNGQVWHDPPLPQDQAVGMHRLFDFDAPVNVQATIYPTTVGRLIHDFRLGYDSKGGYLADGGPDNIGFGFKVSRSGSEHDNSSIALYNNGSQESLPSSFQFGDILHVDATISPNGSITGSVFDDIDSFDFSFPERQVNSVGDSFFYGSSAPDHRALNNPQRSRLDNLRISGGTTGSDGFLFRDGFEFANGDTIHQHPNIGGTNVGQSWSTTINDEGRVRVVDQATTGIAPQLDAGSQYLELFRPSSAQTSSWTIGGFIETVDTGQFQTTYSLYNPAGSGSQLVLGSNTASIADRAINLVFRPDGSVDLFNLDAFQFERILPPGSYSSDAWQDVSVTVDVDNSNFDLQIGTSTVNALPFALPGAVTFGEALLSVQANSTAYVDAIDISRLEVQDAVLGAPSDLPRIESSQHRLPGGNIRAEQGITWAGSGWVTSQGFVDSRVPNTDRLLSRFTGDWSTLITENEEIGAVDHIGDLAYSGTHVFAPIEVDDQFGSSTIKQRIAKYTPDSLEYLGEWDVSLPDGGRLAGLEYANGFIYGIEWRKEDDGAATVIIVDADNPSNERRRLLVDVPLANGIAISDGKVFITSGAFSLGTYLTPRDNRGEIHVFALDDFDPSGPNTSSDVLDARKDGYNVYSYLVPENLHAEGLTFLGDQLWVALGKDVAQLDTSRIAQSRAVLTGAQGMWDEDSFDSLPDGRTSVLLSGSNISVNDQAVAQNLFLTEGTAITATDLGTLKIDGTLQIADATLTLSGADMEVGSLVIGHRDSGFSLFEVNDATSHIVVSQRLALTEDGMIAISPGTRIHMTGSDFQNSSVSAANYSDLANVELVFEGGQNVIDVFEAGSIDHGELQGFSAGNFGIGSLVIGGGLLSGQLLLVDEYDNQPLTNASDALYVGTLVVNPGSTLYLNGISLYSNGSRVMPGDGGLYGGGRIVAAIPEPTTLLLLFAYLTCNYFVWTSRYERR